MTTRSELHILKAPIRAKNSIKHLSISNATDGRKKHSAGACRHVQKACDRVSTFQMVLLLPRTRFRHLGDWRDARCCGDCHHAGVSRTAMVKLGETCSGALMPAAVLHGTSLRVVQGKQSRRIVRRTVTSAVLQPAVEGVSTRARKIAIFVEPSPFSHVSGMKIRFSNLIKGLREIGDEVTVVTPCVDPPKTFCGAKVLNVLGFSLPFYRSPTLLLSLGLSVRVLWHLLRSRPDVIHVSSPGMLVFSAILYAKLLAIPLVVSYHTHVPEYIPKYTWKGLVKPMWKVIQFSTLMADLTLVPSKAMKAELERHRVRGKRMDIWQQAVDTEIFHPRYRNQDMRLRMSGGNPDACILTYIGRLGAEKNLKVLKDILSKLPQGTRLCFVGDGPARKDLEQHFRGDPVVFTGMLKGEELSQAYASADIFMMPSETETLGFVALEAMASGLAVVAVAAGGLVDIITKPGITGFLYTSGDYDAATALTRTLVESPEKRATTAAAARLETEKLGWMAAIRRVRDLQYQRAITTFRAHKRFRWMAIRVWLTRLWRGTTAAIVFAFHWLLYRFRPPSIHSGKA